MYTYECVYACNMLVYLWIHRYTYTCITYKDISQSMLSNIPNINRRHHYFRLFVHLCVFVDIYKCMEIYIYILFYSILVYTFSMCMSMRKCVGMPVNDFHKLAFCIYYLSFVCI